MGLILPTVSLVLMVSFIVALLLFLFKLSDSVKHVLECCLCGSFAGCIERSKLIFTGCGDLCHQNLIQTADAVEEAEVVAYTVEDQIEDICTLFIINVLDLGRNLDVCGK